MSVTRIESSVYKINSAISDVYYILSDFTRIGRLYEIGKQAGANPVPPEEIKKLSEKIEGVRYTETECVITLSGLGDVVLTMVNREEPKLVKIVGSGSIPFDFTVWFQFLENAPYDTRLKLTFEGDLPMMIKMFIKGKLEKGINTLAEGISRFPYSEMRRLVS